MPSFFCGKNMESWLDEDLRKDIRNVFEPRYKRKLTDSDVEAIALNLTSGMETILRFKCKQKHAN